MSQVLLGKKLRMTQYFREDGRVVPVTVVEAGPCRVVQVKNMETDGYSAIQIGFDDQREKVAGKPRTGHVAKSGMGPKRFLREVRLKDGAESEYEAGDTLTVDIFEGIGKVEVTGTSKGCGFAGTVKRHNFSLGPKTHGSHCYRAPGSIGQSAWPSRVVKGMKMSGHMGHARRTTKGLELLEVDKERNLLFIKGGIPGPSSGYLIIRSNAT